MQVDGFALRTDPATGKPLCRFCGDAFDKKDWRQEFCARPCKRLWNSFWQSKGPALARAMYQYRVERKNGALGDLCDAFRQMQYDFEDFQKAKLLTLRTKRKETIE